MDGVGPRAVDPYPCIRCHPWDGRYNPPMPGIGPPLSTTDKIIFGAVAVTAVVVVVVATAPVSIPAGGAAVATTGATGGVVLVGKVSATSGVAVALLLALDADKPKR